MRGTQKWISKAVLFLALGMGTVGFGCQLKKLIPSFQKQPEKTQDNPQKVAYYTCPMHPSVHLQDPNAKCPICGMDLVPVFESGHNHEAPTEAVQTSKTIFVSPQRQQQIGITFVTAAIKPLTKTIRTTGIVAPNMQLHWDFTSRVEGYVEKLYVGSQGEMVRRGQPILRIYSPEILTAQKEIVTLFGLRDAAEAAENGDEIARLATLIESGKTRLTTLGVSKADLSNLENTRQVDSAVTFYSPFQGVIQELMVGQGARVMPGDHLVDVTQLSQMWIWAKFFESDSAQIKVGLPVSVSVPHTSFKLSGVIRIVDPYIDPETRTLKVRIDVKNTQMVLRPDMYVDVDVRMGSGSGLALPFSAMLPTGKRTLVFVDKGNGNLEPRSIQTGEKLGEDVHVTSGLRAGDRVVNGANFLIDSESKIQGILTTW